VLPSKAKANILDAACPEILTDRDRFTEPGGRRYESDRARCRAHKTVHQSLTNDWLEGR
jgi:hypothetical protein